MPLREDILAPIAGENPSGIDLRYDNKLLIHDKIKEARRQDDDAAQGDWQTERKTANFPLVVKIAQETLATTSKDLQVAAWLTEAMLQTERYAGLNQGLNLVLSLLTEFWESVYPVVEDGDREMRTRPIAWIASQIEFSLRSTPIVDAGYSWFQWSESRRVGYDDTQRTDKDKANRAVMMKEGKLSADLFDKAFNETPKGFYAQAEKDLDACLVSLAGLDAFCDARFEDDAPGFSKLKTALTEVRHTIHALLEKKREKEPDPIEPVLAEPERETREGGAEDGPISPGLAVMAISEPADRRQAVGSIAAAAAYLRKKEPLSPAPYLLLRALRWGELRTAARISDDSLLEAPPTELRQQIKRLAIAKRWTDLLEAAEQAMALPGSRAWLDLQRLSVAACSALGDDYAPIARAIQSELRVLLNDLPELLDAMLLDDTPAANPETKAWLNGLSEPDLYVETNPIDTDGPARPKPSETPTWLARSVDGYVRAKDALSAGQEEKAFAIMRAEIGRQRSGRRRFRRTMQMIELAVSAGKDAIAQPLIEDVTAMIEAHKLDAWEDPEQVARDLLMLMRNSKKIQGNAGEKQKLFERICRLDPVQALNAG